MVVAQVAPLLCPISVVCAAFGCICSLETNISPTYHPLPLPLHPPLSLPVSLVLTPVQSCFSPNFCSSHLAGCLSCFRFFHHSDDYENIISWQVHSAVLAPAACRVPLAAASEQLSWRQFINIAWLTPLLSRSHTHTPSLPPLAQSTCFFWLPIQLSTCHTHLIKINASMLRATCC